MYVCVCVCVCVCYINILMYVLQHVYNMLTY